MNIHCFPLGKLKTNCYVVTDEESCIVIDPGEAPVEIIHFLEGREVDHIFLTHCHHDHIAGLNRLRKHTGAPVSVHHSETEWLKNPSLNGSGNHASPISCETPELLLKGNEVIKCGTLKIKVIHTPGHSPGGSCYLLNEKHLFTGDTLLAGMIGPTNLPSGNREELKNSIKTKLFTLPPDLTIYPGHGETSTIGYEKEHNLFPNLKMFY
ncbi:MBL fold metallo-hydrolase [Mesobacillus maritimus]|uniref:MBL fold metallo-hydrolase n=1 Tax=Mesobacillus maritimus TaxID=1643336 RepID=UPI003850833C